MQMMWHRFIDMRRQMFTIVINIWKSIGEKLSAQAKRQKVGDLILLRMLEAKWNCGRCGLIDKLKPFNRLTSWNFAAKRPRSETSKQNEAQRKMGRSIHLINKPNIPVTYVQFQPVTELGSTKFKTNWFNEIWRLFLPNNCWNRYILLCQLTHLILIVLINLLNERWRMYANNDLKSKPIQQILVSTPNSLLDSTDIYLLNYHCPISNKLILLLWLTLRCAVEREVIK